MEFPVFIKHQNEAVYYALISDDSFIEIKRLVSVTDPNKSTCFCSEILNGDFSTRIYISDLLKGAETGELTVIDEKEFLGVKQEAEGM